ncbi:MAG: hypothetical protein KJO50_09515 [Bacteroidia bacterium]|nr:hypothetical protein [Bacteroidia bacterium]
MKEKYLDDLKDIREIMNRSSRFISLSGLSGISAGIFGLAGAFLAYRFVFSGQNYLVYDQINIPGTALSQLIVIAIAAFILAISTTIYFTTRQSKKKQLGIWDQQTKNLLFNLITPSITGGIVCIILMLKGYIGIVIPLTLVFYGLALYTASNFTMKEVRILGFIQIVLGIIALLFVEYSLHIWAVGFGLVHIVYGIIVERKYKP